MTTTAGRRALSFAFLLAVTGGALVPATVQAAPTPPDAGALQQQIENELARPLPAAPVPAPVLPAPAAAPADGGLRVTVSAFAFEGNTRLSEARLQAVVARFTGRPLSFAELQGVAAVVAEAYREAGWVVRVALPPQELADGGVVKLLVVEARFGDVRLQREKPEQPLPVAEDRLRAMARAAQAPGAPLSSRAVDRAILLIDDLPGIAAGGALATGAGEGQTDLVLRVAPEPRWNGDLRVDNTGSRSTGAERLSANIAWASPTGAGDLASVNLLHTRGSDFARLAYRRPVGYGGWAVGVNGSAMQYELVGADFAIFRSAGSATTLGLEASYPLLRGRVGNLSVAVMPERKDYDNEAAGVTTTRYHITTLPLALNGNRSDGFLGGGSWSGSSTLTVGEVDLSGSPNEAADALTTRTDGGFAKLGFTVLRQQRLGERHALRLRLGGQVAADNLDSAEKFYIGGASAVRAYSSSDGSGAEGLLASLEFTSRLPWGFAPALFYDWGQVRVNVDNDFPSAPAVNRYALQGGGAALGWSHPRGFSARATWARRVGDNPNPDPKGNDQDGTLTRDRVWLEAGYAF